MDLSLNLRAILSQRLLRTEAEEGRVPAFEIMLNSPLISDRIAAGEVEEMKPIMERSAEEGMCTFDMSLFDLYEAGTVSYEEALRFADSVNDLRLRIKLKSERFGRESPAEQESDDWKIAGSDDPIFRR